MRRRKSRGQSMVEFTLVGIPILFVLISVFEMSRTAWTYHTLNYSVKRGVRLAVVHGINCQNTATNPNSCAKTIADITREIRDARVGLDLTQTTITFIPGDTGAGSMTCTLGGTCPTYNTLPWPPYDATGATALDAVGKPVTIQMRSLMRTALAMFWPGGSPVSFGAFTLGAASTDYVQF